MPSIDLNCDLGESFGAYTIGMDAEILPYVTSANIACGFHAGDPSVMQKSVLLCKKYGVQVGAHPGLPDLQGFGRRCRQPGSRCPERRSWRTQRGQRPRPCR